jgi:hypothetical protein
MGETGVQANSSLFVLVFLEAEDIATFILFYFSFSTTTLILAYVLSRSFG